RDFGSIAAQEVEARLRRRQAADGRQNAKGIRRQKDDIAGMPALARNAGMRNRLDRIGGASVFGQGIAVEVQLMGPTIHDDILQHRAEADGFPDLRLRRLTQPDTLGIAAALKIKDAILAPAMLIIADQVSGRIGGEGGLSGSAQSKKQGGIPMMPTDIGGAMH